MPRQIAVERIEPPAPPNPALLRNGHRIFCYDGSSCCADVRSGAWAVAADRFAREIVAILMCSNAARSRQLNGNPLDGAPSILISLSASFRQYLIASAPIYDTITMRCGN